MDTELIVIRHGETDANLQGIIQGNMDYPLNDTGLKQAQCIADRLKSNHFDAVYSSDLSRAYVTAKMIAGFHLLEPVQLQSLREWNLGKLAGMKISDVKVQYPDVLNTFSFEQTADVMVPGGETVKEFRKRIADCMDFLAETHKGQRILVVTHAGVLRSMFLHVFGPMEPGRTSPRISNVSFNQFCKRNGTWQLCCWNDISHLSGLNVLESKFY